MKNVFSELAWDQDRCRGDVVSGLVAGAIGGFVASWAMNHVHGIGDTLALLASSSENVDEQSEQSSADGGDSQGQDEDQESSAPATVQAATAVSRNVLGTELTAKQKKAAGPAVHYGYGTLMGALYGGLCEVAPSVARGVGIPYGTVLWLVGDEIAVPALGLGSPPTETPLSSHSDALAAHIVYGVTTDIVRRNVRQGLCAES